MKKVLVTTSSFGAAGGDGLSRLSESGFDPVLNPFGRKLTGEEIISMIEEHHPSGIVAGVEPLSRRVLESGERCIKVISRVGIGLENIDLAAAEEMGVKVYNTPDAPAEAVSELAIGLILSVIRHIASADRKIRDRSWRPEMGNLLGNKKIGIVGFGRIGRRVAEIAAKGFKCEVAAYDPYAASSAQQNSDIKYYPTLDELLRLSDIVTLHLPLQKSTENIIGEVELQIMKDSAIIINTSRGGLIDEKALEAALKTNKISGAGIDVYTEEPYKGSLVECENVVLTSHIGSYVKETRVCMESEAVDNFINGFKENKVI